MKKVAFILSLILFSIGFTPAQAAQTKCKDGTYSSSTGRGTCSSHGGVASKYDKVNKEIKARLLKEHGIVITDPNSYGSIQLGAALALLERQKANAKADAAKHAQAKIDNAKKLEAKLNPNNPRQYVMQTDNFVLCREFGASHSLQNCIGFIVCEQLLVNKGYTTLPGNNTRTSLDSWIAGGRLVQIEDNLECALIKGTN